MHELMTIWLAFVGSNDVAESVALQEVVGDIRAEPNASSAQSVRNTTHRGLRIAPHNVEDLQLQGIFNTCYKGSASKRHYLLPLGLVQRLAICEWRPQNGHVLQIKS